MKTKLLGLLICLLTAHCCICQNGYPRLTLIDNDTLVLFTPIQVNKMNKTYLDLDKSHQINESLKGEMVLLKLADSLSDKNRKLLETVNASLMKISDEKQLQIGIITKQNKKQKKQINLLKKTRTLFTIGGLFVGSITTFFIVQQFN